MKPSGLKEFAYDSIKKMLLTGKIRPGDRIMEADLAAEISVSRTPVREAINRLIAAGFVIENPRHGLFAVNFTPKQLMDLGVVRSALSMVAFDQCIDNMNDENSAILTAAYKRLMDSCERDDFSEISIADGNFHKTVAQVSNNEKLYDYVCDLEDLFIYSRQMETYKFNKNQIIESHTRLYEAILSKDRAYADRMMSWRNVQDRFHEDPPVSSEDSSENTSSSDM